MRGSPLNPSKGGQSFGSAALAFATKKTLHIADTSSGSLSEPPSPQGEGFGAQQILMFAPTPRGFQRGIAIPLWLLWVRVHRERGRSEHPLPVRVFGDFLRVEKVTPRSDRQLVIAKSPHRMPAPRGARRQCDTAKRFTQNTNTPRSTPQRSSVKITRPCGKIAV